MTTPSNDDAINKLRETLREIATKVSNDSLAEIDKYVPDNEHAALTLSLREWIVIFTMVERLIAYTTLRSSKIMSDPLMARGETAFMLLARKFDIVNADAAIRSITDTLRKRAP